MDSTALAYAAGIIDGEGCIYIDKHSKNKGSGTPNYVLRVRVAMTDQVVPQWFYDTFGGNLYHLNRAQGNKDALWWYVCSRKAYDFLKIVTPYLKAKKEQAETAIWFYEYIIETRCTGGKRTFMDPEVLKTREGFYIKMRSLKERPVNVCLG